MATSGQPWAGAYQVLTGDGQQVRPAVAQLQDSHYVVAWLDVSQDGLATLWAQRFQSDGGRVDIPFVLNDTPVRWLGSDNLDLAPLANGGFVATWELPQASGSAYPSERVGRMFDAQGHPTGAEFSIDQTPYAINGTAQVEGLASGGFVVAWMDRTEGSEGFYHPGAVVQVYAANGDAIGGNLTVSGMTDGAPPNGSSTLTGFDVAPTGDGGFYAVWLRYLTDASVTPSTGVYMQKFDSAGHAQTGAMNVITAGSSMLIDEIQAAVQPGTDALVLAMKGRTADNSAYVSTERFDAAGHSINASSHYEFPRGTVTDPQVVSLTDGGYLVSWLAQDTPAGESFAYLQRFDAGGNAIGGPGGSLGATGTNDGWFPYQRHDTAGTFDDGAVLVTENHKFDASGNIEVMRMLPTGTQPAGSLVGGTEGNDVLFGTQADDTIIGGAGLDTLVLSSTRPAYGIEHDGDTIRLTGPDGADVLQGVERLKFGALHVAFDVQGDAGMAYRLYQAAFDRAPDLPGLGFQIDQMDHGLGVQALARNFLASPEFQATYGSPGDDQFVTQLYANVLHRAPDPAGWDYHVARLASGVSRADVLVGFSESPECQADVIGAIHDGIAYLL